MPRKNQFLDATADPDADAFVFSSDTKSKGNGKGKAWGHNKPAPEPEPDPSPAPEPAPDPAPNPATVNDDIWTMDALEQRIFDLTNDFRIENGKTPFQNDERLNAAADDWSMTFGERDVIGHSSTQQVKDYGYDPAAWSENIAWGFGGSAETVVNAWINSPGHRAAMLGNYEEMGVGVHYVENDGGNEQWSWYYTQEFGTEIA